MGYVLDGYVVYKIRGHESLRIKSDLDREIAIQVGLDIASKSTGNSNQYAYLEKEYSGVGEGSTSYGRGTGSWKSVPYANIRKAGRGYVLELLDTDGFPQSEWDLDRSGKKSNRRIVK